MGPHPLFIEKKLTKTKKTNKEITRNYQNCKESCRAGPHLLFMEEAQQKLIFTALTRMRCRGIFMIILLIFIFLRASKIYSCLFYWYQYFWEFQKYVHDYFIDFHIFKSFKNISMIISLIFIFFRSFKNICMIIFLIFIFLGASRI